MAGQDSVLSGKSDEELVELARADQELFGLLVERYQAPLQRYIRRLTNVDEEETEDILQDVFIKIYRNLNDFDPSLKFSSWAYRITRNEVISNFRKRASRPQTSRREEDQDKLERIMSDDDIAGQVDKGILKDKLMSVLGELDIKYREAIILRYFEEKDYSEMSDILKKPVGTIATLIARAKKLMRARLEKENINQANI